MIKVYINLVKTGKCQYGGLLHLILINDPYFLETLF